jgi:pyruvate carboxylase subunit B
MKPIVFNNTVLRDGHQSLAATRMTTAQMLPAAADLDSLGFGALETWGGATIDSCIRFLGENPFARLDALKPLTPRTPHMMLLRGQNIVQYTSFPDDVVEAFVRCTATHGMDIFRIFDALNDLRNIRTAVRAVKALGKHAQGTLCFTTSPVHTPEMFVSLADGLAELEVDSICIKDMAGLIPPVIAHQIVSGIKKRHPRIPIVVHSHETAGLAGATYVAVADAGADAVDCSIVPFANGTGQPDTVRMMALMQGHPRVPSFDLQTLARLRRHFEGVAKELASFMSPANDRVDSDALSFQVPGGMLSNFRNQLKEMKMETRMDDVLAEIPVVRKALGWIPLVTPTSQIVGTQAMLNVKFGRWQNLAQATVDIALGKYGRTPGPVEPEVTALAVKKAGHAPITERPADSLAPRMTALKAELAGKGLPTDDDTAVLWAMFPREMEALLKPKPAPAPAPAPEVTVAAASAPTPAAAPAPAPTPAAAPAPAPSVGGPVRRLRIHIDGRSFETTVEECA